MLVTLAIDCALSFFWSSALFNSAWNSRSEHPMLWIWHAEDFPWLPEHTGARPKEFPSLPRFLFGTPRKLDEAKKRFGKWLFQSTIFRRFGSEPYSRCLLRGGMALIFGIVLIGYGTSACVINPYNQFYDPMGLPTKHMSQTSYTPSYTPVSGYLVGATPFVSRKGSLTIPEVELARDCGRITNYPVKFQ